MVEKGGISGGGCEGGDLTALRTKTSRLKRMLIHEEGAELLEGCKE